MALGDLTPYEHAPMTVTTRGNHRRWNPLTEEWVLVSPKRTERPWSGAVEKSAPDNRPSYDPGCYLCPGNTRAKGDRNPNYESVFCFDNDYAALNLQQEGDRVEILGGVIRAEPQGGRCRVVCFSPRHDLTLARLGAPAIATVIDTWDREYQMLAAIPEVAHVMIFENKGEMMGCSNPHPHGQIWSTTFIPNLPAKEIACQERYFEQSKERLLVAYAGFEENEKERIVCSNQHWIATVPFWATWPFETLVLPKRAVQTISELTAQEKHSWSELIAELTVRYDNLFETSFPYSMGVYQKPTDGKEYPGFQFHQVFFPPLLRSATVRKFMVGFELCAESQRDITVEQAAERLRAVSATHYAS